MTEDRAEMLRILFAIPQSQIDRDIAAGQEDFQRLVEQTRTISVQYRDSNDPKIAARHHHQQMVQGKVARRLDALPEEYRLFLVAMAADEIAEEAVCEAHDKGRLGELGRQMDEIRKREGVHQDHHWVTGGPADYQEACQESEQLFDKVHDTIFTTLLARYRLDDVTEMYEKDRDRYDELREEGRKLVFETGAKK